VVQRERNGVLATQLGCVSVAATPRSESQVSYARKWQASRVLRLVRAQRCTYKKTPMGCSATTIRPAANATMEMPEPLRLTSVRNGRRTECPQDRNPDISCSDWEGNDAGFKPRSESVKARCGESSNGPQVDAARVQRVRSTLRLIHLIER